MYRALFIGGCRGRGEVKAGRWSVKKKKNTQKITADVHLLSPSCKTLAPIGLGDLVSEEGNSEWKQKTGNLCTITACLSGHVATECQLSEEREFMLSKDFPCLYLNSLESLGFSFIIHPTQVLNEFLSSQCHLFS